MTFGNEFCGSFSTSISRMGLERDKLRLLVKVEGLPKMVSRSSSRSFEFDEFYFPIFLEPVERDWLRILRCLLYLQKQ